jgi:Ras-related protein Rab-32
MAQLSSTTPADGQVASPFKVLVVGDAGVGKTSFIKSAVLNTFSTNYKSTVGVDFSLKTLVWNGRDVRLQLWDIAGQERFGSMTHAYYKGASAAFIVYDKTKLATFEGAGKWKADIDAKVTLPNKQPIPVVLLANKCDLPDDPHFKKTADELNRFCRENNFLAWFSTSAKDKVNLDEAINKLTDQILKNDAASPPQPSAADTVSLDPHSNSAPETGGCPC